MAHMGTALRDELVVVRRPWSPLPRRPSGGSIWGRLFWVYFVAFVAAVYGPAALEGIRMATGSVPEDAAATATAWVVGWVLVASLAAGLAGGPWWMRPAITSWVLPSRFGAAVLSRSSLRLLTAVAGTALVLGAVLVLGFDRAGGEGFDGALGAGALGAATVAVLGVSAAMLVQPRRPHSWAATAFVVSAAAAVGAVQLVSTGVAPMLGWAASGRPAPSWIVWSEIGLAAAAAVVAVARTPAARIERIDARARALRTLNVILFNRDLRSLRALAQSLSGEQPRASAPARVRRLGPVADRYRHNLRRSPARRMYRIAMLVVAVSWGWWLLDLGSSVGAVPVTIGAWFIALEMAEPLGQELDRSQLLPSTPIGHRLRHLAVVAALTLPILLSSAVVLAPVLGVTPVIRAVLALGPGMIVAATAAAGHTLLRPDTEIQVEWLMAPEAFGFSVLVRESIPVVLTAVGLAPLFAHDEWSTSASRALAAGGRGLLLSSVALGLVLGTAWWRASRSERRAR